MKKLGCVLVLALCLMVVQANSAFAQTFKEMTIHQIGPSADTGDIYAQMTPVDGSLGIHWYKLDDRFSKEFLATLLTAISLDLNCTVGFTPVTGEDWAGEIVRLYLKK